MSSSLIFTSLKLAMIAKLKEKTKLTEDTVANLGRDIYHMQTLPALVRYILSLKLDIDTIYLQEDFNAEQRATAKASILLPTGPADSATSRKPDETAADALRDMS